MLNSYILIPYLLNDKREQDHQRPAPLRQLTGKVPCKPDYIIYSMM